MTIAQNLMLEKKIVKSQPSFLDFRHLTSLSDFALKNAKNITASYCARVCGSIFRILDRELESIETSSIFARLIGENEDFQNNLLVEIIMFEKNLFNNKSLEMNVVISQFFFPDIMNISAILLKIQMKLKTNKKSENLQCVLWFCKAVGTRREGVVVPIFWQDSKHISLKKALDYNSPPRFSDLPTALFCSNSSRYLLNLLPEKREDKKGLKLVCTFK